MLFDGRSSVFRPSACCAARPSLVQDVARCSGLKSGLQPSSSFAWEFLGNQADCRNSNGVCGSGPPPSGTDVDLLPLEMGERQRTLSLTHSTSCEVGCKSLCGGELRSPKKRGVSSRPGSSTGCLRAAYADCEGSPSGSPTRPLLCVESVKSAETSVDTLNSVCVARCAESDGRKCSSHAWRARLGEFSCVFHVSLCGWQC